MLPLLTLPLGHAEFFTQVWPNPTTIDPRSSQRQLQDASVAWIDRLEWTEDWCVEIWNAWPIFDLWCAFLRFLCSAGSGGKGCPDIVLRHLPLCHSSKPASLTGLLALQVRRWDLIKHCPHLTKWSAPYSPFDVCFLGSQTGSSCQP